MTIRPKKTIASVLGVLTVLVTASGACFLISRSAIATPQFGAATGQPCAACHVLRQEIPGEWQQAAEILSWARRVKRGLGSTSLVKTGCIDE